ncbi:MAG: hypothetical protein ACYDBJ_24900 [Aggregatilineales bacterium]
MTFQEKSLYHQIHPLKLLVDIGITFPALYLLWQHQLIVGLIVTFVPSIIVSALLIRFADLEPYKRSAFGRYVHRNMTSFPVALRVIGLIVMCVGAWLQIFWLILMGLAIVLLAWLRGFIFPSQIV